MDFTAWNWASSFRLHEAACLIAGVMPISKRHPISEELPPQARPILIKLAGAYYEWFLQKKNPERPKSVVLDGVLNEDGSLPPFPALTDVTGEVVSRDAIHRFLTSMVERGLKSCYDFGPIGKAGAPIGESPQSHTTPEPQAAPEKLQSQSRPGVDQRKGTQPSLTDEQKTEIVRLYQCGRGVSVYKLATQFNVSRRTIDAALGAAGVKQVTPRKGRSAAVKTAREAA